MKVTLNWLQNSAFAAENENGQRIIFDGPAESGGENLGMRPMEGMLSAAAACASFDVRLILQKSKQTLRTLQVNVEADRAETTPAVFTRIHLHFILSGDLRPPAAERAVSLSVDKYCSVLTMLNKTVQVSHSWEIRDCGSPSP